MTYRYVKGNFSYGTEEAAQYAHPSERIERLSLVDGKIVRHERRYYANGGVEYDEVKSCSSWVRSEDNVRRAKVRWRNGEVAAESSVSEKKARRLVHNKIAALKAQRTVYVLTLHDNVAGIFTTRERAEAHVAKNPSCRITPCELDKLRLVSGRSHTAWWSPPWLVST